MTGAPLKNFPYFFNILFTTVIVAEIRFLINIFLLVDFSTVLVNVFTKVSEGLSGFFPHRNHHYLKFYSWLAAKI